MESHYILEEPVNGHSLREFILNFTSNKLSRSFKSKTTLNSNRNVQHSIKIKNTNKMVLMELNSTSFLSTILEKNKVISSRVIFTFQLNLNQILFFYNDILKI